jgi:site-specific recombinase XerD
LFARWIKLKEATEYAKIGKDRLKRLASDGVIKGAPDPDSKRKDWIFDRQSIDSYREAQMPNVDIEQKALASSCGIDARLHDLRHSAATYMLASSIDIREVQAILGHAQISTTTIYADVLDAMKIRAIQKMRIE